MHAPMHSRERQCHHLSCKQCASPRPPHRPGDRLGERCDKEFGLTRNTPCLWNINVRQNANGTQRLDLTSRPTWCHLEYVPYETRRDRCFRERPSEYLSWSRLRLLRALNVRKSWLRHVSNIGLLHLLLGLVVQFAPLRWCQEDG